MNKFTKAFHRGERGFTLIELLIVIVILGILAAVAIPQVTKFIRSGKVSAANAELALVKTAVGAALADGQVSAVATPGTLTGGTPTSSPVGADVNVVAYNATGPILGVWVADYIQGATGDATARSAGGNGSTGETTIPLTGTYTIAANGNVTSATYAGVTWDTSNLNFK